MSLWEFLCVRLGKKERKLAKNDPKRTRGRRAPAPYTKYKKQPYKYNTKAWAERWPNLASTLWDKHKGFIDVQPMKNNKYSKKREYA